MPPRVLFVNGGILGLLAFDRFLRTYLPRQTAIAGERLVLSDALTLGERVRRRLVCARWWRDGLLGIRNADLARYRQERHAGWQARRRIAARRGRFDVLHFHRQATAYGSLDLMRRVPSIVTVDCTQQCVLDDATSRLERASYAPNVRRDGAVFRRAAAIVATSAWAASSLRRMYPDVTAAVHVAPDPVLIEGFDRGWMAARAARAAAGARPRVLFVGGDFPRKGGYDLLRAWASGGFARRASLDLVTDWPVEGPLPAGVTLARGVRGYSPEWGRRWAAADIFVMPTRNEAFGLVFQEAAAAGLPAIGSRLNAIPEIVADGETGLLVPPRDEAALAAALTALLDAPERRLRMGQAARTRIEEVADPAAYMDRLTAMVRGLYARSHG